MKFVDTANNFTKFVRLTNNFWKVCKMSKKFMKFVDWKVGFKYLIVFLYLSFTCSNILIGKHVLGILFKFHEYFSQVN